MVAARNPRAMAIYRDDLLPLSNTFVNDQARSMTRFAPLLVGCRRTPGLTPSIASWTISDRLPPLLAAAHVAAYKGTRRSGRLKRRLGEHGAELLMAHFAQDGFRAMPTAQALGIPLFVVCHGSDVFRSDEAARHGNRGERALAGRWTQLISGTTTFLATSKLVRQRLLLRGVPADKVRVHYTGVPIPSDAVDECATDKRAVLFVGRLVRNKGCAHLLEASRFLPEDVAIHIVGDGPERERLRHIASTLPIQLADRVTFHGSIGPASVKELMRQSHVVCVPSVLLEDGVSENMSTVALEAQAAARPIVAYNTGALCEAIADNQTGLLVEPGAIRMLASELTRVLDDTGLAGSLGAAGRRRAIKDFDIRTQTARLEAWLCAAI